jgi:predicted MFS family arabinose efflux permease
MSAKTPLVTRPLLLRFVSIIGSSASLYLLLSVVPLYAQRSGSGAGAAGMVTAALMLTTVAGEMATPRLLARYGYRLVVAVGLVLLGLPALLLIGSADLTLITVVCLVRGLGFAITTTAGGAMTAALIPAERRGEGLALVGVVAGVPGLVALPLGVWLADHVGFPVVFVAAAVSSLVALVTVPGMPKLEKSSKEDGVVSGLRTPALVRPAIVFAVTAMAAGIVVTFLPFAVAGASGGSVTLALFAQAATATVARWFAGRHGDKRGSARLLVPGLLTTAAGVALLAVSAIVAPNTTVVGAAVFGAGFGISQNASIAVMYSRVTASGYGTVSAIWNGAYDAGWGAGAAGFGMLVSHTGGPAAFGLTAVLMIAALLPARRDRATRRTRAVPAAAIS